MRLKNCIFLLLFICVLGCTDHTEGEKKYSVMIENQAGVTFTLYLFTIRDGLLRTEVTLLDSFIYDCDYSQSSFEGIEGCYKGYVSENSSIDSLRIVFENGKGYACGLVDFYEEKSFCMDNVNFFGDSDTDRFEEVSNRTYKLVLTEEDYNNAYELPE